jgi:hypothetical protein
LTKPRPSFASNDELTATYALAEALGKTVEELDVGQPAPLSMDEYVHWLAFYRYREKVAERKRAQGEAEHKAKAELQGMR